MGSGYRLVLGILTIVLVSFLWIPLNYVFSLAAAALNAGITDAGTISRNNMMAQGIYYTLFIIIVGLIIYIIKPDKGEDDQSDQQGGAYYGSPV
ncbi:MAG: hypothetical protein NTU57_02670 [Candidatus Aenigmarchaeota archaeon]|nr:hypothetical protein [Candidatus Aenigmarchaeota archaeon]